MEKYMEFKVIPGFSDYEVNQLGVVRSGDKIISHYCNKGTVYTFLYDDEGVRKCIVVNKLVALAFLGKPQNPTDVALCINGDRNDCRAENLKWVSRSEAYSVMYNENNPRHQYRIQRLKEKISKKVGCYSMDDKELKLVKKYPSISAAAKDIGVTPGSIMHALKHQNRKIKDYYWRYL